MTEVIVNMTDLKTGKAVQRRIDIANVHEPDYDAKPGWECQRLASVERQRDLLLQWIDERANAQHSTMLDLVSWSII